MQFNIDIDKSIETSLYILNKLGSCDLHKLYKIIYFAEKNHLSQYGRPITGDFFIAMKYGPVPSFLCNVFNFIRKGNISYTINRDVASDFEVVDDIYIGPKREANCDLLSLTDLECLDNAINDNKDLSFRQLTEKSHDDAWEKADYNSEISPLDMANCQGVNIEMIRYIQLNMEHQNSFSCP